MAHTLEEWCEAQEYGQSILWMHPDILAVEYTYGGRMWRLERGEGKQAVEIEEEGKDE